MASRLNESCSGSSYSRPDTRPSQAPVSSPIEEEGCPVIDETGAVCGETRTLSIFQEFRQIYDDCIRKMEGNKDDNNALRKLAPFRKLVEDLWEQNAMLVETVEELEQEATCRVAMLQNKLDQCSEKDVQNLLRQKDREISTLTQELCEKTELLGKFCSQNDDLRRDIKNKSIKYQQMLQRLKELAAQRVSQLPPHLEEEDEFELSNFEAFWQAFFGEMDGEKIRVGNRLYELESQVRELAQDKCAILAEKKEANRRLDELKLENCALKNELIGLRNVRAENDDLLNRLECLKKERDGLLEEVNNVHQNVQDLTNSFKESRWALTNEVAEKHDQILEMKRCMSALEEQIRQAEMKTHFRDNIIKELRKELKNLRHTNIRCPNPEVSPRSRHRKTFRYSEEPDSDRKYPEECQEVSYPGSSVRTDGTDSDDVGMQDKLDSLRQVLKVKIQQIQRQDEAMRELEEQLCRVKRELSEMKEKCDDKEFSKRFAELVHHENKLRRFRDRLLRAVFHIENALKTMSICEACETCACKDIIANEKTTVKCIRKDIEAVQVASESESYPSSESSPNSTRSRSRGRSRKRAEEPSDPVEEFKKKKCKHLKDRDFEMFRIVATGGMATLEEMKEQLDCIHTLISKYAGEVHSNKMPSDCEKGQLEECENKYYKLHAEFDAASTTLKVLVEKLASCFKKKERRHRSKSRSPDSPGRKSKSRDREEKFSEKLEQLKADERDIEKQISEKEAYLEGMKKDLEQMDMELNAKKSELIEHEKEMRHRVEDIVKVRRSLKKFRSFMQNNQSDGTLESYEVSTPDKPAKTSSNLSTLSAELQELYNILANPSNYPATNLDKCMDENRELKEKLNCIEKCIKNKDETLALLQQQVKKREAQVEELTCKIQRLTAENDKLKREIEEKNRQYSNVQESMSKTKEFEMKIKDDIIAELQYQVCELDYRLKLITKEVIKKGKELDELQDEILYVSSKNFFLNREIDILEPKVGKLQKYMELYESMVGHLQGELQSRECEIETLHLKVKDMERDLEVELKKCEQRAMQDSECINNLSTTIRALQVQIQRMQTGENKPVEPTTARDKLVPSRGRSVGPADRYTASKDPWVQIDVRAIISRLKNEVRCLRQQLREKGDENEIKSRTEQLENLIRQGERRQQVFTDRINELQKLLEDTTKAHEAEKKELIDKVCREGSEVIKCKMVITQLNQTLKCKTDKENTLKEIIRRITVSLDQVKRENKNLKTELNAHLKMKQGTELDAEEGVKEMDKIINSLEAQKSSLKSRCCAMRFELEKEEKVKQCLEQRISELNNLLEEKTLQLNQISKHYECTSAKAQEALLKLKETEERLKCMNSEMGKGVVGDEDDSDEIGNELEECHPSEKDMLERSDLEESLQSKTVECCNLLNEVQCLQVKLKSMQGQYLSSQANKDCELSRLNRELKRLECEVGNMEKENVSLKTNLKKVQEELNGTVGNENDLKQAIDKKDNQLRTVECEKGQLLQSVDELQKRLEELCIDNTAKEKENNKLQAESSRLKKEVDKLELALQDMRYDVANLRKEYQDIGEKLQTCEKKRMNLEKMYSTAMEENAALQSAKNCLEREICQLKSENVMLKEKISCAKRQKERDLKKLEEESVKFSDERAKFTCKIKELTSQINNLENKVIPQLEDEILRKERCLENCKVEIQNANISSQKMRDESMKVIQCTKKYLMAQRCANEEQRSRFECTNDNRFAFDNDNRDLEEQLNSVARMNEYLYFELQNESGRYQDSEPRSFSPQPWGCPRAERDSNSPEYYAESGFQSMQQSPTNMHYVNDFNNEMKRASSQWNRQNNDYSPCRKSSVR